MKSIGRSPEAIERRSARKRRDYLVTVCDACCTASCWHGDFLCGRAGAAGTKQVMKSRLTQLALEAPYHYSRRRILEVTGQDPCPGALAEPIRKVVP